MLRHDPMGAATRQKGQRPGDQHHRPGGGGGGVHGGWGGGQGEQRLPAPAEDGMRPMEQDEDDELAEGGEEEARRQEAARAEARRQRVLHDLGNMIHLGDPADWTIRRQEICSLLSEEQRGVYDLDRQEPVDWEDMMPSLYTAEYFSAPDPNVEFLALSPPVRGQALEAGVHPDNVTVATAYQCFPRTEDVVRQLVQRTWGDENPYAAAAVFRTFASQEEREKLEKGPQGGITQHYLRGCAFREEYARQWRQEVRRWGDEGDGLADPPWLPREMAQIFPEQLHRAVEAVLAGYEPTPLLRKYIEMHDARMRMAWNAKRGPAPGAEGRELKLTYDNIEKTGYMLRVLGLPSELYHGDEGVRTRKAMAELHARHQRAQMGLLRAAKGDAEFEVTNRFVQVRESHLKEIRRLEEHAEGKWSHLSEAGRAELGPKNRVAARRKLYEVMLMDAMAAYAAHEWIRRAVRPVWDDSGRFLYIKEFIPIPPRGKWREWDPEEEVHPQEAGLDVRVREAAIAADKLAFANHMASLRIRQQGGGDDEGIAVARAPAAVKVDLTPAAVLNRMRAVFNSAVPDERKWVSHITPLIAGALGEMAAPERMEYDSSEWNMGATYRFVVVGFHPALLNENTYQLRQDVQTAFRFVGIEVLSVLTRPPLPGSTAREIPFYITAVMGPQLLQWKAGEAAVYCGVEPHRTRLYGFYEGEDLTLLGVDGIEFEYWVRGLFAARPDLHPAQVMMLLKGAFEDGLTMDGEEVAVQLDTPRWVMTTRVKLKRGPGRPSTRGGQQAPERRRVYVNPRDKGLQVEVPFRNALEASAVAETSKGGGIAIHLVLPPKATGGGAYRTSVQLRRQVEKDKRRSWGEGAGPVFFILPNTTQMPRLVRENGAAASSAAGMAELMAARTKALPFVGPHHLVGYRVQETSTGRYDLGYIPVVWAEGAEKVAARVAAMMAYRGEQGTSTAMEEKADGSPVVHRTFDPLGIPNGLTADWEVCWDRSVMDEDIYFANNSDVPMSDGRRVSRLTSSAGSSSHSDRTGSGRSEGEARPYGLRAPTSFRLGRPDACPAVYIDPSVTAAQMGPVQSKLVRLLETHNSLHFPAYTYGGEDPTHPQVWQNIPVPTGMRDGRVDFPELLEHRDIIYTAIQSLAKGGGARVTAEMNGWVVMRRGSSIGAAAKMRKTGRAGSAGGGGRHRE
jgi:hypothetical protein